MLVISWRNVGIGELGLMQLRAYIVVRLYMRTASGLRPAAEAWWS